MTDRTPKLACTAGVAGLARVVGGVSGVGGRVVVLAPDRGGAELWSTTTVVEAADEGGPSARPWFPPQQPLRATAATATLGIQACRDLPSAGPLRSSLTARPARIGTHRHPRAVTGGLPWNCEVRRSAGHDAADQLHWP